jgi:hypothetical protein
MMNYNENLTAEGLTEVSFDLMSRGRPVFGRYDAGSTQLAFGGVQSSLLFTAAELRYSPLRHHSRSQRGLDRSKRQPDCHLHQRRHACSDPAHPWAKPMEVASASRLPTPASLHPPLSLWPVARTTWSLSIPLPTWLLTPSTASVSQTAPSSRPSMAAVTLLHLVCASHLKVSQASSRPLNSQTKEEPIL